MASGCVAIHQVYYDRRGFGLEYWVTIQLLYCDMVVLEG